MQLVQKEKGAKYKLGHFYNNPGYMPRQVQKKKKNNKQNRDKE